MPRYRRLLPLASVAALTLVAVAGAAPTIDEYTAGLTTGQKPSGIAAGPDGGLWFTEIGGSGALGRIAPDGTITEFTAGLTANADPTGIAAGPDGNVWFTEQANPGRIGRITPSGVITEFTAGLSNDGQPTGIAAGPDGAMWFTEFKNPGRIGRITTSGAITEFTAGLTTNAQPDDIAAGPDGNLWFTEKANPGRIGRITPAGVITEFTTGLTANAQPSDITAGPDGNLWFTEFANPGRIGRITPAGVITEFTTGLTANAQPSDITAGADGNLWFTEFANPGRIGRVTPAGVITEFSGLTSNSQPIGIAAEPDGNVWFTEQANPGRIGRITLPPGVAGTAATGVTSEGATLGALASPRSQATTYVVEYGTTTAYGAQTTAASAGAGAAPLAVGVPVSGLDPGTTYHFRIVATNASGTTTGADATFTTSATPQAPPPATTPPPASPPSAGPPAPSSPVPPPSLGRSVGADVVSGTVRVRTPGSSGYAALDDAGSLPVGSTIDARDGVLTLTAALPGGGAQTGTFWGGLFGVRQDRGTGMTHLFVRRPAGCSVRAAGGVAESFGKRRRRPPQNDLWGSDSHGRFSTHGANSAATVRGTRWLTVERCDGTLTRVVSGRVLVRDLRTGRRVMLTANRQYLARR